MSLWWNWRWFSDYLRIPLYNSRCFIIACHNEQRWANLFKSSVQPVWEILAKCSVWTKLVRSEPEICLATRGMTEVRGFLCISTEVSVSHIHFRSLSALLDLPNGMWPLQPSVISNPGSCSRSPATHISRAPAADHAGQGLGETNHMSFMLVLNQTSFKV